MNLLSIALMTFLGLTPAENQDCAFRQEVVQNTQITRIFTGKRCIVDVTPRFSLEIYRSYLFSSNGALLVFNSFGTSGQLSKDTGARTFFFIPALQAPDFSVTAGGQILVQSAANEAALLDPATSELLEVKGNHVTVDPHVSGTNRGGVSLRPWAQPLLDTGWAVGRTAYQDKNRFSRLLIPGREDCRVRNDRIFDYATNPDDPTLKIATQEELDAFIDEHCP